MLLFPQPLVNTKSWFATVPWKQVAVWIQEAPASLSDSVVLQEAYVKNQQAVGFEGRLDRSISCLQCALPAYGGTGKCGQTLWHDSRHFWRKHRRREDRNYQCAN